MTVTVEPEINEPQTVQLDGQSLYNSFLAQLAESRQDLASAALFNYRIAREINSQAYAEKALSQAIQSGDGQLALASADLLKEISPNNAFGYRASGLLRIEAGAFEQGYADIEKWLALDPAANTAAIARSSDELSRSQRRQLEALVAPIANRSTPAAASALLALGLFAELNGATPQVISSYAVRSIERSPSADAWALRIRHETGDTLQASIEEALNDFSEDRALHVTAMQRLIQLQQPVAALTVGADWLRYARNDYELRRYLSGLAIQQEQWPLVEEIVQPLLSVAQYRDEGWYRIAAARYYQDDLTGAKNAAARISPRSDYYAAAWEISALVERTLASLDSAREILQIERNRNPEQGATLYAIEASLLRDDGLHEEAGLLLKEALAQYPDDHDIRLQYGYWVLTYESLEAGIAVLLPLIETDPMSHEAANAIAYSYVELEQNFAEAERLLDFALGVQPNNAAYLDSLGWLRFKQGKLNEALTLLNKALEFSDNPEIIGHKVEVLVQQGKVDEARALWEVSTQAHPNDEYLAEIADRFGWR
ncbi:tetratricopeptide repeat protein [Salinibius halmophilus]|uniref:tetratricopeptide repeat protein n=1 Tax=Salinibius halmophilus TaxID=1853216 RepID=UPI001313E931|nr:tetratricopeptide repeat protein [Salinibius halmophilus]